jgi:putative addiction module antidote
VRVRIVFASVGSVNLIWYRSIQNCTSATSAFSAELERYNISGYTKGMVVELKLRKVGNSVGVVLPKEVLARLRVGEGDTVCVTDAADGSLRMTAANPEFARQMDAVQDVVRRYRNTLRELAK